VQQILNFMSFDGFFAFEKETEEGIRTEEVLYIVPDSNDRCICFCLSEILIIFEIMLAGKTRYPPPPD
jgi:hypothetical protein